MLPGLATALFVPEHHCALNETVLEAAPQDGAVVCYGVDGAPVAPGSCSALRYAASCRPEARLRGLDEAAPLGDEGDG